MTLVALGWHVHFQSPMAYLWAGLFVALVAMPSWRIAQGGFGWSGALDAVIRAAVIAFAAIVFMGLLLGGVGLIGIGAVLCMSAVFFAASLAVASPRRRTATLLPALPIVLAAVALPLLAFVVVVGLTQPAPTLYDSVSYHLVFAARWLQDQRLSIVPTPFSDPAQAYQPGNGELFFLWLMLPFHGDLLARIGQLPFLALAGLAVYALARRSGARREHAAYAPFFFLLARPVIEQAAGADVDLVCTAMFVTSLYLGIVAIDRDTARDWMLWGASVGLFLGTKYLSLVYVAVLLVLPLLRGVRWKALWAVPGIIVLAAPWYVRNWVVAGSPIYPASLKALGMVIAQGAYSREAMNNSVFHVTDLRLLPAIVAHAFGAATILVWLPCAAAGVVAVAARRRWWPGLYLAAVPLLIVALFWFGIPDNGDSRFLLPAVAVAMIPLTWLFGADRRWNAGVHAVYAAGAAWIVIGAPHEIPASLPWFMGNWLTLDGLVLRDALPPFAAAGLMSGVAYAYFRRTRYVLPVLTMAWCATCVVFTFAAPPPHSLEATRLLNLSSTFIRSGMLDGWDWLHHHVEHATIANTGNNLPYPLFDEHLSNRVRYVNLDRHGNWQFHDYARTRRRAIEVPRGALATPSGQLMPLAGPVSDASRPRYERWEGSPDAWLHNLRDAGVTHLFVTVLSAYEIGYLPHNEGGFPIEDDWARADPGAFVLLYENNAVRLYQLMPAQQAVRNFDERLIR